jgi:nucleoside-diphosphate-sugar epimerase
MAARLAPLLPEPDAAHPDHPEWAYGMGKRAAEDVFAAAWARERFPSTRLRLPMVHGERDYHRRLESYLWRLLDGDGLVVPDGGVHRVRHVYGMDVVRTVLGLLESTDTFGQAYNLCQEETPTLDEWLRTLARVAGTPARLVSIPSKRLLSAGLDPHAVSPLSGPWMSFLDPSRARALLGFRAEPLERKFDKIVTSFYAHPPVEPPPSYASRVAERSLMAEVAAAG